MNKKENSLYVEKYRPHVLDEYIGNEALVDKFRIYIEKQDIPHLLLHGTPGTGKTSIAKILVNAIDCDVMYINASDENNVDTIRDKVKSFASSMGFKKWKIVILDESDFLTNSGQAALRNIMETFSKSTRFILTCNYVEKIIPAIQSRCQTFNITPPSKKEVALKLNDILKKEGVDFDIKDLAIIINSGYPDIRKILNTAQSQIVNGKLVIDTASQVYANYMTDILAELTSTKSIKDTVLSVRQILADSKVKDFTQLYKFLYDNVDEFAKNKVADTIVHIAEYQYKDVMVVDTEINVMAMFVTIILNIKG
jgi:DNA polymerase III delta prime subunit